MYNSCVGKALDSYCFHVNMTPLVAAGVCQLYAGLIVFVFLFRLFSRSVLCLCYSVGPCYINVSAVIGVDILSSIHSFFFLVSLSVLFVFLSKSVLVH